MKNGTVSQCGDCFLVNGRNLYVYGGELHYFRIPIELWKDRLLKAKRCFLNTVSTYVAWNWHEQNEGKLDFSEDRDIDHFLDLCKQLGLYTIVRPGPYICAEWDSGGFPRWLWAKDMAFRSLCPRFIEYSGRWYDTICAISRRHLITHGGTAILFQVENEFFGGNVPYLLRLAKMAEERGIDVPIVHNKCRPLRGTDVIDTIDLYPPVWKIDDVEESIDLLRQEQPDKPPMIMELEGGWFSLFGGPLPTSRGSFPAEWTDILTKTCIAKGINAINFYMFHGGTNFGYWTAKDITTTYDYEAAVREWGELGDRYWVMRRIGSFIKTFNEALAHSKPVEGLVGASNSDLDVFCRKGDKASFLFIRNIGDKEESVRIKSSLTQFGEIPVKGSVQMRPKSMLTLPLNYKLDMTDVTLLFSTSQVFSIIPMYDRTVIVVYGPVDTPGEVCFKLDEEPRIIGDMEHKWDNKEGILRFNYVHPDSERVALIQLRRSLVLVVTNDERAARTWLPQFLGEEIPMMSNIYFIRDWNADSKRLVLSTELVPKELVKVSAVFPRRVKNVSVNGRSVAFNYDEETSVLYFSFSTKEPPNLVQTLNGIWKMKIESPESDVDFDDSKWSRWTPGCPLESLGFLRNGYFWYRCRFQAPKEVKNTTLVIPEVKDYAAVFLNGVFIGKGRNKVSVDGGKALRDGENLLSILVESTGHCHHPCLTKTSNGILSQIYLSEEERVELKDWKFKISTLEMKPGLPAAIDISRWLKSDEPPPEASSDISDEEWQKFTVLHDENVSQSFLGEPDKFKVLWLRTWVDLPRRLEGKSLVLSLKDMSPGTYKLYVNGALKGFSSWTKSTDGAAEAVDIDITDQVTLGKANLLLVAICKMYAFVSHFPKAFPELVVYSHRINGEWGVTEGLHGEREKWFTSELDDSGWEEAKIHSSWGSLGLAHKGIIWYRKKFHLENDPKYVAPLRLTLNEVKSRCLIFLNGRLIGRYMDIGPQKDFYLPEPWLKDENTLALAVESFDEDGGITGDCVVSPYCGRENTQIRIDVE